jgi:diaminopimelate decarboxylase
LHELEAAFRRLRTLTLTLRAQGHGVERLDFGGGLGIRYHLDDQPAEGPELIEAYGRMVAEVAGDLDVERGFEPGRLIVGNSGILLTRVLRTNPRPHTTFLVVDAAMNDLIRPAMYDAYHEIWPVRAAPQHAERRVYDVVGPICETGDTFCSGRTLPETKTGDLLAIMTAGAYGAVMSSTYNSRLLVPEVIVSGQEYSLIRPRRTFEELLGLDQFAPWQRNP